MKPYIVIIYLLFVNCFLTHFVIPTPQGHHKSGENKTTTNPYCECQAKPFLSEAISCERKMMDNHAGLYWSFTCDSSWLTFESPVGDKKILYSLDSTFIELTNRLGYLGFDEFNNTFLYTNAAISGCCQPDDYYLHDKNNGNLIKYLGRTIYTSENRAFPFAVSITNSKYGNDSLDLNSLTIYNFDTRKEFNIPFPKGEIKKGMEKNDFMYPEELFGDSKIKDDTLIINYHLEPYLKNKDPKNHIFKIALNKYRF